MPIHVCTVYGCFHATVSELNSYGDHMVAKTLNYLALQRKSLLTSGPVQ